MEKARKQFHEEINHLNYKLNHLKAWMLPIHDHISFSKVRFGPGMKIAMSINHSFGLLNPSPLTPPQPIIENLKLEAFCYWDHLKPIWFPFVADTLAKMWDRLDGIASDCVWSRASTGNVGFCFQICFQNDAKLKLLVVTPQQTILRYNETSRHYGILKPPLMARLGLINHRCRGEGGV